jgi:tRNA threonylcarbamoyladenosine biosynthesis protein TsaB
MNDFFPILAVETTGELCSAAVLLDEKNFVELNYLQKYIHSQKLIDIVDNVFKTADMQLNQMKSIAVSMGLGSFTGLRIGLSAVKGIAFGANIPIITVPTFDAFALQLSNSLLLGTEFAIGINASIEDFYFSKYRKGIEGLEIIEELKLIEKDKSKSFIGEEDLIFGNINQKNILSKIIGPSAYSIGYWAYIYGNDLLTSNYDYLEPNYFKKFIAKVKS